MESKNPEPDELRKKLMIVVIVFMVLLWILFIIKPFCF